MVSHALSSLCVIGTKKAGSQESRLYNFLKDVCYTQPAPTMLYCIRKPGNTLPPKGKCKTLKHFFFPSFFSLPRLILDINECIIGLLPPLEEEWLVLTCQLCSHRLLL